MTYLTNITISLALVWGWLIFCNRGMYVNRKVVIGGALVILLGTSPMGRPYALYVGYKGRWLIDWPKERK